MAYTPEEHDKAMHKVNADGTFTKINDSIYTVNLKANGVYPLSATVPKFSTNVTSGDRLWLFGKTDMDDGAYLYSDNAAYHLVDIEVSFRTNQIV